VRGMCSIGVIAWDTPER